MDLFCNGKWNKYGGWAGKQAGLEGGGKDRGREFTERLLE